MKTVAIYSQEPVLAHGLVSLIHTEFQVLGIFASVQQLREQILAQSPDVLVLDMDPAVDLEIVRDLYKIANGASIVIWVDTVPPEFASQCLSFGVRGVLSKAASIGTHMRCIAEAATGGVWIDPALAPGFWSTKQIALTPRERQLMASLAQGLKNKEIAWNLGITEGTVKVYLSKLFDKVGAGDRFELALMALKNLSGSGGRHESDETGAAFPAFIHLTSKASQPQFKYGAAPASRVMAGTAGMTRRVA